MSSSSNSSSSSSGSETEESCNEETMEFSCVVPYDENLEPLATEEEAKEQEERMAQEAELEREYEAKSKLFLKRYVDVLSLFLAFIMKLFRCCTVPGKNKLTVSTRNSILDPRCFRESRIEFRGSRHSKNFSRLLNRDFEETIYFSNTEQ